MTTFGLNATLLHHLQQVGLSLRHPCQCGAFETGSRHPCSRPRPRHVDHSAYRLEHPAALKIQKGAHGDKASNQRTLFQTLSKENQTFLTSTIQKKCIVYKFEMMQS